MRKILAIIRKDITLRFSGVSEWLFFLILPIVFTLVLSGGTYDSEADNRIRLLVVDQSNTSLSNELITALEASSSVNPDILSLEEAESVFSQRRVSALLIIPPGCEQEQMDQADITLELRMQPNNTNSLVAQQAVLAVVGRLSSAADIARRSTEEAGKIRPFLSDAERQEYFSAAYTEAADSLDSAPERLLVTKGNTPDQIEYDPRANSSAGQMITWVFIPLIGISELFADERQRGTLRRILTTPTSKRTYLFGTILGQVFTALIQMSLLVGFGILIMKVNWGQNVAGLVIMLSAGALAAAALGTMLGTFVKTASQAQGLSIMLGMVTALMGGCWYPLELFPRAIQQAVKILPTTWTMQGLLDLLIRGQGVVGILPEAGVLLGFALVFFIIGILRFRYE